MFSVKFQWISDSWIPLERLLFETITIVLINRFDFITHPRNFEDVSHPELNYHRKDWLQSVKLANYFHEQQNNKSSLS